MRPIVRKFVLTAIPVLEASAEGRVTEVGTIVMEGKPDMKTIRRKMGKEYPNRNVFAGNSETTTKTLRMDASEFLARAEEVATN